MSKAPAPPRPRAGRSPAADRPADDARRGGARAIADLVPAISDTAFRRFGFVQSSLLTRWHEIVGERLARVTQPESLRFPRGSKADGTLRLRVGSAASTMVQHMTVDIMAATNRFFGYRAVARVRIVHGPVRRAAEPPAPPLARAAPPPVASDAVPVGNASVRAIADPELKAVLEGLAASLARHDGLPKIS